MSENTDVESAAASIVRRAIDLGSTGLHVEVVEGFLQVMAGGVGGEVDLFNFVDAVHGVTDLAARNGLKLDMRVGSVRLSTMVARQDGTAACDHTSARCGEDADEVYSPRAPLGGSNYCEIRWFAGHEPTRYALLPLVERVASVVHAAFPMEPRTEPPHRESRSAWIESESYTSGIGVQVLIGLYRDELSDDAERALEARIRDVIGDATLDFSVSVNNVPTHASKVRRIVYLNGLSPAVAEALLAHYEGDEGRALRHASSGLPLPKEGT